MKIAKGKTEVAMLSGRKKQALILSMLNGYTVPIRNQMK